MPAFEDFGRLGSNALTFQYPQDRPAVPSDFTVWTHRMCLPQIRCLVLELGLGSVSVPSSTIRVSWGQSLDLPPSASPPHSLSWGAWSEVQHLRDFEEGPLGLQGRATAIIQTQLSWVLDKERPAVCAAFLGVQNYSDRWKCTRKCDSKNCALPVNPKWMMWNGGRLGFQRYSWA